MPQNNEVYCSSYVEHHLIEVTDVYTIKIVLSDIPVPSFLTL